MNTKSKLKLILTSPDIFILLVNGDINLEQDAHLLSSTIHELQNQQ